MHEAVLSVPVDADEDLRSALIESHRQAILSRLSESEQMELAQAWSQQDEAARARGEDTVEGLTIIALARSLEDQERLWNRALGTHDNMPGAAGPSGLRREQKRAHKRPHSPDSDS